MKSIVRKILKMFEVDLELEGVGDMAINIYADLMKRPYLHYKKVDCKNLGFTDTFNFEIFLN